MLWTATPGRGVIWYNMARQISLCITTWMRTKMTMASFEQVLHDERISEIIIVDDASTTEVYDQLEDSIAGMDKVTLYHNGKNLGCYLNKKQAISLAENDYVIILDSDNIITPEYLDRIFERAWTPKTIFAPSMGKTALDYTQYEGRIFSKETINIYLGKGNAEMLLNTFNFFINRDEYLKIFDKTVEPVTSDSIWICYLWLKAGGNIMVVPGMWYIHSVHNGSHYQNNCHKAPEFYQYVLGELKKLK